jgi:hypothetical protein
VSLPSLVPYKLGASDLTVRLLVNAGEANRNERLPVRALKLLEQADMIWQQMTPLYGMGNSLELSKLSLLSRQELLVWLISKQRHFDTTKLFLRQGS